MQKDYLKLEDLYEMNSNEIILVNRVLVNSQIVRLNVQKKDSGEASILEKTVREHFLKRNKLSAKGKKPFAAFWGYEMKVKDALLIFGNNPNLIRNAFKQINKNVEQNKEEGNQYNFSYYNEVVERFARSQKLTEEIVKNDDYINWIEDYTTITKGFTTNDEEWLYCPGKISEENIRKIEKLTNFYEAIEDYASNNYIYPTPNEYGNQYYIKNNNIGYEIGVMVGQGTLFFINRLEITSHNADAFIDFKLIKENKVSDRAEKIRKKLLELEDVICDLVSENVPIEAITETAKNRIRLIKEKNSKL